LVGVGANRFTLNWADIDLPDILEYRGIGEFETKNAHNSYIQWLAEFGLLGSIPLVILLAVLTIRGLITTRRAIVQRNLVPLAIYLSFLQMSIHMWVITALTGTVTWFIYGLLMAVIKNEANKKYPCIANQFYRRIFTGSGLRHICRVGDAQFAPSCLCVPCSILAAGGRNMDFVSADWQVCGCARQVFCQHYIDHPGTKSKTAAFVPHAGKESSPGAGKIVGKYSELLPASGPFLSCIF
jgi:hypothetical protein